MTITPREIVSINFHRKIVQFKQHTFSRAFMVRIFRVLTYMHLHAREIICLPDDTMAFAATLNWLELLLKHVYC